VITFFNLLKFFNSGFHTVIVVAPADEAGCGKRTADTPLRSAAHCCFIAARRCSASSVFRPGTPLEVTHHRNSALFDNLALLFTPSLSENKKADGSESCMLPDSPACLKNDIYCYEKAVPFLKSRSKSKRAPQYLRFKPRNPRQMQGIYPWISNRIYGLIHIRVHIFG
jgi:hypothetical protein